MIGRSCFVESMPVFGPGISPVSTSSSKPVGVLTIAIGLTDTAKDSGLIIIKDQIEGMMEKNVKNIRDSSPWNTPL